MPASRLSAWACAALAVLVTSVWAAAPVDKDLPAYSPQRQVQGRLTSAGDAALAPLAQAWLSALVQQQLGVVTAQRWDQRQGATAIGALMFELADVALMARPFTAAELAPYAHQFAGDMMKSPLLVRVAGTADRPAYIAVNKRAGAPLPLVVQEFLLLALSRTGQDLVAANSAWAPLSAAEATAQLALLELDRYVAPLDPALPVYQPGAALRGVIRSVGSDGMKTLMDRWMRDFQALQPGVQPGARWEHLGTLNGFHALLTEQADLAPMGRELWPEEHADYAAVRGSAPLEIRVARGGFNTPQRTTAQAVFVNARNPVAGITLAQLAALFGERPAITRWGQLGLTGEWADRAVNVYSPPRVAPNAMSMQSRVLHGGGWNSRLNSAPIAQTAQAIAQDIGAIGFGGFEDGGPGLKALDIAEGDGDAFVRGSAQSVASGRYPLTRFMYIRLHRAPGAAIAPPVLAFLQFILSRQGQEPIRYSGYFPLTADEVRQELAKLR